MKRNHKSSIKRLLLVLLALMLAVQAPISTVTVSAKTTAKKKTKAQIRRQKIRRRKLRKKRLRQRRINRRNTLQMTNLSKKIQEYIRTSCPAAPNGDPSSYCWAVYVKNLKTGKSLAINDGKFFSASTIKLFAMATAYDQVKKKKLTMDAALENQIYNMIAYSNNDAFNNLVYGRLGEGAINNYCMANGYKQTQQYSRCGNGNSSSTLCNMTSASDCGILLEKIYRRKLVSKKASDKMLSFLKAQTFKYKIPSGLPSGIKSANKTGESQSIQNDTAIVYGKKTDYIICIFTNTCNASQAIQCIRNISRMTYDALN